MPLPALAAPPVAPGPSAAAAPAAAPFVLLPTAIAEGDALRLPRADEPLAPLAASLDALLSDTAQDLGFAVEGAGRSGPSRLGDAELLDRARARGVPVVLPSLRAAGPGEVELRLALADPVTRAVAVRRERLAEGDLPIRAVVLLRDLLQHRGAPPGKAPAGPAPSAPASVAPPRSEGRIPLIVNTTLFGGLVGFSIQRASGSDDPRLLYPLLAVGAGIGLGGALVASAEWDISTADAWYLASGLWWPSVAAHLLFQGRFHARPETERWAFGLLGGTAGVTVATLGLALRPPSDGGALLAHSTSGLGLLLGGLGEVLAHGDTSRPPVSGMGYGAAFGWLAGAAAAVLARPTPWSVLSVDLGAVAGGLAGAAAGSPLLLEAKAAGPQRAWAGIAMGGAIGGGVVGYFVGRPREVKVKVAGAPVLGVMGESVLGDRRAPIVGVGWGGPWP